MIVLSVVLVLSILSGLMLYRSSLVFEFEIKLLHEVSRLTREDINNKTVDINTFMWRYDELNKVSSGKMMYPPWRRLKPENYWDDVSFLEPSMIKTSKSLTYICH